MSEIALEPGAVALADWRAIYRGGSPRLDPACRPGVAASAAAVARIVARGEPVYGVNTGFGKLASVRIETADLETLQRNIVLSHAAGVGEPTPLAGGAADDGAETRQSRAGRLGGAAADGGHAGGDAGARARAGSARARLGRRLRRSRPARASGGGDDRRRRGVSGRRAPAGRRRRWRGPVSRR